MRIGIPAETGGNERRVALTPGGVATLRKAGHEVLIQAGAGEPAGYRDHLYTDSGAAVAESRDAVFQQAEVLLQVRTPPANPEAGEHDLTHLREGKTVIGLAEPLTKREPIEALAKTGVTTFALELLPRITRAQSMDVLSSQANIAGYKSVILAADYLPRLFPMMMTAAGTIAPAKVFVIGAGVAGLQAIATARRLGAKVTSYDIRPAVKEQVESLGATFLQIEVGEKSTETSGGYAQEMDAEFYRKQQEMMSDAVAEADAVITTAAVPGKRAPVLVNAEMIRRMKPGAVIIDLAAERGGNCELTKPDELVVENDVTILGPRNVPAQVAYHASQTYARNITSFVQHLAPEGQLTIDLEDQITFDTLLTRDGEIVQPAVREHFDLPALSKTHAHQPEAAPAAAGASQGAAEAGTESSAETGSQNEEQRDGSSK